VSESSEEKKEGVGPRFRKGSEELDQLKSIERQKQRRRKKKPRRKKRKLERPYPLIERDEKSRRRVQNRFDRIKDLGDAIDEFGS
jgi:hypothetical protein